MIEISLTGTLSIQSINQPVLKMEQDGMTFTWQYNSDPSYSFF